MQCSESREKAARLTSLLTYRTTARVATWNTRTMLETGKTIQVAREMKNYKMEVLGLGETRWLQTGQLRLSSGEQLLHSRHIEGGAPIPVLRVWPWCWHRRHMVHSSVGNLSTPASSQPSLPPRRKTSGWTSSSAMLPPIMRRKGRKMTWCARRCWETSVGWHIGCCCSAQRATAYIVTFQLTTDILCQLDSFLWTGVYRIFVQSFAWRPCLLLQTVVMAVLETATVFPRGWLPARGMNGG